MANRVAVSALMLHTDSGILRTYRYDVDEQYADNQEFWWNDGNAACDCNRVLFFCEDRWKDESDSDLDSPCNEQHFDLLSLTIA